ncbi:MAG TPA: methyltransferase domain-containing protein [Bryobacteraceae bacterium]|nr:methyltransferase domain-containing protein [Bryobacteraceae bacterium]
MTNLIRFLLDDCLPPILRDRRSLISLVAKVYCGAGSRHFGVDFKRRVEGLPQEQVARFYEAAAGCDGDRVRASDMTREETDRVIEYVEGDSVLEVGAGAGDLAQELASTGRFVVPVDLKPSPSGSDDLHWCIAFADCLPFADRSFDTVVAAHTLEHVVNFEAAVAELRRVAKRRIIVVVPKQRYYRYTVDYHLHFFPDREQLVLRMGMPDYHCEIVTGDLFYVGFVNDSRCAAGSRAARGSSRF